MDISHNAFCKAALGIRKVGPTLLYMHHLHDAVGQYIPCICYIKVYFVRRIIIKFYCEYESITPISSRSQTQHMLFAQQDVFSLYCGFSMSWLPFLLNMLFRSISRGLCFDYDVYRKVVMTGKWSLTGLLSSLLWYSKSLTCISPSSYTLLSTAIFFSRHTYLPFDKQN